MLGSTSASAAMLLKCGKRKKEGKEHPSWGVGSNRTKTWALLPTRLNLTFPPLR